ncbi:OmpA family protein [Pseudocolwellia sp. HL-MZ19]|uniref:OmpA family protein n=1 Tax=unclassified Pseudocolwellia TaxID=2848178 RepID=UPI003CF2B08C
MLFLNTLYTKYTANVYTVFSVILLFITIIPSASAFSGSKTDKDHPLISRFEGAMYFSNHRFDYIPSHILTAPYDKESPENSVLKVAGKGSFITYMLPNSMSLFEMNESFKNKLNTSMFTDFFECEKTNKINTCGKSIGAFSHKYDIENGFQSSCTNSEGLYIASAKVVRTDGKNSYVFICVNNRKVNQTIIEEKDFTANKIKVATEYSPTDASLSVQIKNTRKDIEGAKDHPLLNRFPNSTIAAYKEIDFTKARLPIKTFTAQQAGELSKGYTISPSGKVTFIQYRGQAGLSQYQVYENYIAGLKASKIEILLACRGNRECNTGMEYFSGISSIAPELKIGDFCKNIDVAVITAKVEVSAARNAYLFICISNSPYLTVSQTIVEEKPLKTGVIQLSTDEMASAIAAKGKVALYGIHFASNSDKIMKTSTPAFKQLANLFSKQPTLNLYVVGHTDSQGEEAYNQKLAENRAKAVIKELVQQYNVAPERLQARGVGELVPVSTNQASEGRQLNRRVELVQK